MNHVPQRRRIRHANLIVTVLLAAGLVVAAPVAARVAVDPSTLNPPIADFVNPVCGWAGNQVICSTDRTFDVIDAETGIVCDGQDLLETSHRHVFGQRLYNAQLDLVEIRFVEDIEGELFIQDGGSVRWTGTDRGVQTLSVPGDRDTGVLTNSGAWLHFYPTGGGSIALSGRTTESFDTGESFAVGNLPDFDFCALVS
jgi:hypothetical protein